MADDDRNQDEDAPAIKPHYGSAVEGNQRFPRPELEREFLRDLDNSNGIAMFGLRRIGKSTLTRYAEDEMRRHGYTVVSVDAQGFRALDQLLFEILRALPREEGLTKRLIEWVSSSDTVPTVLRDVLSQAAAGFGAHDTKTSSVINDYWQAIADQIAQTLRTSDMKVLLTVDEFPFMCKGILEKDHAQHGCASINQLLSALRLWRDAGLKMVLTGSIGMAAIERQYGIEPVHLNDMQPFTVPPLGASDPEEPRRFVEALARGLTGLRGWTGAHSAALLEESVACYPSFLQFAFIKLSEMPLRDPQAFAQVFETKIRDQLDGPFLDQFDSRLHRYRQLDDNTAGLATDVLNRIVASRPNDCDRTNLAESVDGQLDSLGLSDLLKLLHEDGFVLSRTLKDGSQYWRLSSQLVLTWWTQRGLGRRA